MQTNSITAGVPNGPLNFLSQARSPSLRNLVKLQVGKTHKCSMVNASGKNPQLMKDKYPSHPSFRGTVLRRYIRSSIEHWAPDACKSQQLSDSSYIGFSLSCLSHSPYSHLPNKLHVSKSLSQAALGLKERHFVGRMDLNCICSALKLN